MSKKAYSPDDLSNARDLLQAELGLVDLVGPDGQKQSVAEAASLSLAREFANAVSVGEGRRGRRAAFEVVRRFLPERYKGAHLAVFGGEEAASVVRQSLDALTLEGMGLFANRLSAYEWIWMIRRLPLATLVEPGVGSRTRAIMVCLALGKNHTSVPFPEQGMFAVTRRRARSLAYLFGYARVYSVLEASYRVVGKGGMLELNCARSAVSNISPPDLRRQLDEYDARVREDQTWGGLGIYVAEISAISPTRTNPEDGPIAAIHTRSRPEWLGRVEDKNLVLARYIERFVQLEEVFDLLSNEEVSPAANMDLEIGSILPLLWSYTRLVQDGQINRTTVQQVGYSIMANGDTSVIEKTALGDALCDGIAWLRSRLPSLPMPSSARELIDRVSGLPASPWRGKYAPLLFPIDHAVGIDWHSATMRFLSALRYPKQQGATANVRAKAFEETVRAALERSACAPADWLRDLLGRHLRRGGVRLGEIDAGASLPGGHVHLLISCKSYPFTEEYERGEFNTVRNVGDKITRDLHDVAEFASDLMRIRRGDNYEIPTDAVLVPLVVTPRLMYSSDPACSRRWFSDDWGPRAVSGFAELLGFLNGYDEGDPDLDDPTVAE